MHDVPPHFRAFTATQEEDGSVTRAVVDLDATELPPGEVTVRVEWSSVNFKDGLATIPKGRVARISPLVPGIDLAGTVIESDDARFTAGQKVLAHGYDIGVARHGGYAEVARVGRTSITVNVEVFAERGVPQRVVKVTEATLTYVAVDQNRKPRPVVSPERS